MGDILLPLLLIGGLGAVAFIAYENRCEWFSMCLGVPLDPAKDTVISPAMTVPASATGVKHHATGKGKSGGGTVPTPPVAKASLGQITKNGWSASFY